MGIGACQRGIELTVIKSQGHTMDPPRTRPSNGKRGQPKRSSSRIRDKPPTPSGPLPPFRNVSSKIPAPPKPKGSSKVIPMSPSVTDLEVEVESVVEGTQSSQLPGEKVDEGAN